MPNDDRHVVLLGDSIFDNGVYVPGDPAIIDQLRSRLPAGWRATLLAVDGDRIGDVARQLSQLPSDATDLVISVGGNDALDDAAILDPMRSADELPSELHAAAERFRAAYSQVLEQVLAKRRPVTVCTIYDQCPFEDAVWRELVPWALAEYNAHIVQEATQRGARVIELREICTQADDYAALSPIEPSAKGGMKIVEAIVGLLRG